MLSPANDQLNEPEIAIGKTYQPIVPASKRGLNWKEDIDRNFGVSQSQTNLQAEYAVNTGLRSYDTDAYDFAKMTASPVTVVAIDDNINSVTVTDQPITEQDIADLDLAKTVAVHTEAAGSRNVLPWVSLQDKVRERVRDTRGLPPDRLPDNLSRVATPNVSGRPCRIHLETNSGKTIFALSVMKADFFKHFA